MNTKLTMSLDKEVIDRAKQYARRRHQSHSKMVENYLLLFISDFLVSI